MKNIFCKKFRLSFLFVGYAWQATLYSALSNSSLIVAFVSENYLKSKMCQEEFSIGSSQFTSCEYDSHLVAVQLDSLDEAEADAIFFTCPSIGTKDGDEKAKEELITFVQENACHADYKKVSSSVHRCVRIVTHCSQIPRKITISDVIKDNF